MSLISPADQERLRTEFEQMTRPVRLVFFTQTLECETCDQARQILDELPPLSSKITIEEVNFLLERERAAPFGIDRVPAIAVTYADEPSPAEGGGLAASPGPFKDTRIRFLGLPAGYEFINVVQAVLLAGGRAPQLGEASRERLGKVDRPLTMQVFTTPT
jgi:alkyl hydroperoxide reductase subunit AhpF